MLRKWIAAHFIDVLWNVNAEKEAMESVSHDNQ
jgi:hypothetical protein